MSADRKAGEFVMYPNGGVCRIDGIETRDFSGGQKSYYVMHPLSNPMSKIFVPTDSESLTALMTPLIDRGGIDSVIRSAETSAHHWIPDRKMRAERFTELLRGGERSDLLWLIKTLSRHKAEVTKQKKRLYATDERVLTSATKLITEEFSFVLGIEEDEVIPYIKGRVELLAGA